MPIPMDVVVFNELRIVGSLGCPIASYTGMLSMVAAGKLQPRRLVETVVSVREAGALLDRMTNYSTVGFSVINNWAEGATSAGKEATWEKKLVEV
jgi:propanol-preferring alcohol dehydrogenase